MMDVTSQGEVSEASDLRLDSPPRPPPFLLYCPAGVAVSCQCKLPCREASSQHRADPISDLGSA